MSILLAGVRMLLIARSQCGFFMALTLLLGLPCANSAQADDLTACLSRKVTFDGITPLHYAVVKAGSSPHVDLESRYSGHCPMGQASCAKTPYLVSGDAVAIGKTCGTKDFVQYIGDTHISAGWVDSTALSPIAPPPPSKPPVIRIGKEILPSPAARHYQFKLTAGTSVPVCEAYQQRLNQTDFYLPPYCGRPESTLVPGFVELQRRYLSTAEFAALYSSAQAVLNHKPLKYAEKRQTNPDGSVTYVPFNPTYPDDYMPDSWTYDPPIDIENSGSTYNLIMGGDDERSYPRCGQPGNFLGGFVRGGRSGLIVSADGKTINRDETYAVFGITDLARYPFDIYSEISDEFGIFRYKNLNYFDAMFNPANFGSSRQNTLDVFLYTHQQRQKVCEYNVSGLKDSQ